MGGGYGVAALGRLGLAVSAALLVAGRCAAQATAPSGGGGGGGNGCMPELVSLSPCMGYMSGNATAPGAPCCSALSRMLGSSPGCLCMVLGGNAATLGIAVDGDRLPRLPVACRVQTPPASQCDSVGAPLPSPATPSNPNITPAGFGSKATPTTQYSDGNASKAGNLLGAFVAIVAASFIHGV